MLAGRELRRARSKLNKRGMIRGLEMTMSQFEVTSVGRGVDIRLLFSEKRGMQVCKDETGTGRCLEDFDVS